MVSAKVRPVILCGGAGTRLWPLSRKSRPKQMLPLVGELSLLQQTALRTHCSDIFAPPLVVTGGHIAGEVADQLEAGGVRPAAVIVEPAARNTAPAIALAAQTCADDEILLVMPSDHAIGDLGAFNEAVGRAVALAREGWLVTLGLKPDRAETGYGYIRRGDPLDAHAFAAAAFVEKPDVATAQAYFESGLYLWNGGIFIFARRAFERALREHARRVHDLAAAAMAGAPRDGPFLRPSAALFAEMPSISIDYAVMEHAERIAVVPVDMGWSDIGGWDALNALLAPDPDGNRLRGQVIAQGAVNCAIRSEGPLVVALGVENLTVVATSDAVLILPAGGSHRLADAVKELQARGSDSLD